MLTVAGFERMRRDISVKAVSEQAGIDAAETFVRWTAMAGALRSVRKEAGT